MRCDPGSCAFVGIALMAIVCLQVFTERAQALPECSGEREEVNVECTESIGCFYLYNPECDTEVSAELVDRCTTQDAIPAHNCVDVEGEQLCATRRACQENPAGTECIIGSVLNASYVSEVDDGGDCVLSG
jgi:hypothetical protein